jgi:adenylate cyclase
MMSFLREKAILKKKPSIRFSLLTAFTVLFACAIGLIVFYSHWTGVKYIQEFIESRVKQASQNVVHQLSSYLNPVLDMVKFISVTTDNKNDIFIKDPLLIKQQIGVLESFPQVQGICNGVENSTFMCVYAIERMERDFFYRYSPQKVLPKGTKYEVEFMDRAFHPLLHTVTYYSSSMEILGREEKLHMTFPYAPPTRPWYIGAKKVLGGFWTPPYIYARIEELGITASYPVFTKNGSFLGAIGADVTLNEIGDFLEKSTVSPNSISFLVNQKGEIIGYQKNKGGKLEEKKASLSSIFEAGDPQVPAAYALYTKTQQKEKHFLFHFNKIEYTAYFTDLKQSFGKDWVLGIVVPIDDFALNIKKALENQLLISVLVFMLSSILIYLISKHVSTPIHVMSQVMFDIGKLNFNPSPLMKTWFKELHMMSIALMKMKTALQSFERYLPKVLIQQLIKSGEKATLGGEKKQMTVFFSDIKGFTSISEKLEVELLMKHLTEYFDELTKIIIDNNGLIDKYIGDSIMAFWGAPLDNKEHAQQACRAALLCQKRLRELDVVWEKENKVAMPTRIGICTGEMIVGNMGSFERLNYTLLGDNVNLGSRLEGINKFYGTSICISEVTYEAIKDQFFCRVLDIVAVKGKEKGVKIYEVIGEFGNPELLPNANDVQLAQITNEAFQAYSKEEWTSALDKYQEALVRFPQDKVAIMFVDRCKMYKENPPPRDWGGIHVFTEK